MKIFLILLRIATAFPRSFGNLREKSFNNHHLAKPKLQRSNRSSSLKVPTFKTSIKQMKYNDEDKLELLIDHLHVFYYEPLTQEIMDEMLEEFDLVNL